MMVDGDQVLTSGNGPDWNFILSQGFEDRLRTHWNQMLWSAFKQYIPTKGRLLEIGCGSGKISVQASQELDAKAVGVDINGKAIEYARGLAVFAGVVLDCFVASGLGLEVVGCAWGEKST